MPPLLHTPDQITERPLVALRVMLVPTAKLAEPVVPTGTLSPAGVEETVSPARPVAVRVSAAVTGAGAPVPQTFATPPPPQVRGAVQTPQVSVPPQPSGMVPQFFPWAAQVVGVQGAGGGAGALATTPDQRVECVTPPTVQLRRIDAVLPAATVPGTRKLTAVARTSGAAWAANGVTVAVPEMPPTVMAAPVHPAGKREGSMLMRLTRTLVPFVRASPAAGKAAERLGFSPAMRVSFASRVKPMHLLPEQLSPTVAALPSLQASALLRWPQPTVGGVQKSVVPHGLPVIGCGITKSPMAPAGGAGGVASHRSQVLMKELGSSGVVKVLKPMPQVGGTRTRQSSVKLMLRRPGAAAVRVVTPNGCVIV